MPLWVIITASVFFLIAYALYAEVMRENAYLCRTIKVEEGQQVVDTGLHGIVRLRDEEDLLTKELPGYAQYKQKVKYKLLPFIW